MTFRFILALLFWIHENTYFGWHAVPESPEECIADGIVFLLLAIACIRVTSCSKRE